MRFAVLGVRRCLLNFVGFGENRRYSQRGLRFIAMIKTRFLWRRSQTLLLAAVILLGGWLHAGTPILIDLAPITFIETKEINLLGPSSKGPSQPVVLPKEVSASEYSLEYARRLLIPGIAGSVTTGDFDGDGNVDIFAITPDGANHLLHNTANGRFEDVTGKSKLSGYRDGVSATFADYNHSGRLSLFVAGLGGVKVFRNDGHAFKDETQKAGLMTNQSELCTRVVFFDADGDGFLDIVVSVYVDLNVRPTKERFVFPNNFAGAPSRFYRNNGNGTFTDVTILSGLDANPGRTRSGVSADFDGDGRQDILLLRDEKPPILYLNRGAWKFEDFTWNADEQLSRNAFFEAQVADFNRDGKPDLALWSTMASRALLNQGAARFELVAPSWAFASYPAPFGFHGTVADLDDDDSPDLLVLDSKGAWRALLSPNGQLQESQVVMLSRTGESLIAFRALVAARLGPRDRLSLLGLQPNGTLLILKRKTTDHD